MELAGVAYHNPLARIGLDQSLHCFISSQDPHNARRAHTESFIRSCFAQHHEAHIRQFMPNLVSLEDEQGHIQGAFGLRLAQHQPLFLERYLDQEIEHTLAQRWKAPIQRAEIIEVGNLAAQGAASARFLIVCLTHLLASLQLNWVVFTGTPGLLNSFRRLGIELISLGKADPERMGSERSDWGHYYATNPQVTAGYVPSGHQRLIQQGIYPRLGFTPFYALEQESLHVAHG